MMEINYIMLFALPFLYFFLVASRNIFHPVMVSMFAGMYPFLVGIQLSLSEKPELAGMFGWILASVFAGSILGKKRRFAGPGYAIDVNAGNTRTHHFAYRLAVLIAIAGVGIMFMKRGVPILADEPNIAKVTFTQGGGWVLTRFVRYFLLTLF